VRRPASGGIHLYIYSIYIHLSLYLSTFEVPTYFKQTTIVPIPKKPVALTSIIKCFERLVRTHICSTLPDTLDPLQYAYPPSRSTDDAITLTVHTALSHLEKGNTYMRILLIDYSSAFNTIVPVKLILKLRSLGLNSSLYN